MYETVLFDLDGTLTDPGLGITNSVMYALDKMGFEVPQREELYPFIGPPLHESFQTCCAMTGEQAQEAIVFYREYFSVKGLLENRVYDGIIGMLTELKAAGKHLVLATSKPEKFAKAIMEHFGLDRYICDIAGATMDTSRSKKGQVIAYALKEFGVERANAVMVGDREHDVIGARENALPCVGVSFGYGSREELLAAGAVAVVDSPEELGAYLLGG